MHRASGRRSQTSGRLALVRDPDRREVGCADAAPRASASAAAASTLAQISSGSCSTQPGLREVLRDLAVAAPDRAELVVDDEAGRAGRPLVDGQDHGGSRPACPASGARCGLASSAPRLRRGARSERRVGGGRGRRGSPAPHVSELAEDRRLPGEAELVELEGLAAVDAASYGGPTERLVRAVLIIEPRAILVDVTRSPSARIATSSMNLPYSLSPILRNGRSSKARM